MFFILLTSQISFGFVLLSGNREAKLISSEAAPEVVFVTDGNAPSITEKDAFPDIADLDNQAYFQALVGIAMGVWNDVPDSYLQMSLEVDPAAVKSEDNLIHTITVEDVNLSSSAFASPNVDGSDIIDCDIVVGSNEVSASSLAYTILHEIGHCIGLGHNHGDYQSVMGYSRGSKQLKLALDDKLGLVYLYPNTNVSASQETYGCAAVGQNKMGFLLFLLPLLLLLPRKFQMISFKSKS